MGTGTDARSVPLRIGPCTASRAASTCARISRARARNALPWSVGSRLRRSGALSQSPANVSLADRCVPIRHAFVTVFSWRGFSWRGIPGGYGHADRGGRAHRAHGSLRSFAAGANRADYRTSSRTCPYLASIGAPRPNPRDPGDPRLRATTGRCRTTLPRAPRGNATRSPFQVRRLAAASMGRHPLSFLVVAAAIRHRAHSRAAPNLVGRRHRVGDIVDVHRDRSRRHRSRAGSGRRAPRRPPRALGAGLRRRAQYRS